MSDHAPIPWLKKPTVEERAAYWRAEIIRLWDQQNRLDGMATFADSNWKEANWSLSYHLNQMFDSGLSDAMVTFTDWQICEIVLSYWSYMARCTRLIYSGVRNVDLPKWQRPEV